MGLTVPASSASSPGGNAVEAKGVVKRYPLFLRRRDRAWAFLGGSRGIHYKTALDRVNLSAGRGEAVGIIGENGSGKTTLLRLVSGIGRADSGTIRTAQPVAAILELGLGFHPEFTGRENALLYGSLIGIPEATMGERLDDILDFAELGEFADQPVRTYSSGMAARLGFAVATEVEPAVLVVDEALAVGDGAFQKKCVDRMTRFKSEGRTVLFCSHAMYLVTSFCERALWLREGRIEADGPAHEVVRAYEDFLLHRAKRTVHGDALASAEAAPRAPAHLASVRVTDPAGRAIESIEPGEGLVIRLEIEGNGEFAVHAGFAIDTLDGKCLVGSTTHWDGQAPVMGRGTVSLCCRLPSLPAEAGSYIVSGFLMDETGLAIYDQVRLAGKLIVEGTSWRPALLRVAHVWEVAD